MVEISIERDKAVFEVQGWDQLWSLRSRLEAANVEVASKSSLLKVVDPALPPGRHTRPRKTLNTAAGGAAGLLAMVMLAFFLDYVRRAQRH